MVGFLAASGITKAGAAAFGKKMAFRSLGAAGYVGAGYGASAALSLGAQGARAYHGDDTYDAAYGTIPDMLASGAKGMGLLTGAAAMFGKGPVGSLVRDVRTSGKRLGAMGGLLSAKGKRFMGTGPTYGSSKSRVIIDKTQEIVLSGRVTMRSPFYSAKNPNYIKARAHNINVIRKQRAVTAAFDRKLGYMGKAAVVGTFAAAAAGSPAIGAAAIGIGAAAAARNVGWAKSAHYAGGTAAIGAALGAGAAIGSNMPIHAAPEGNITEWKSGGRPTDRLNFSTAGLTLALHHNRRVKNDPGYQ